MSNDRQIKTHSKVELVPLSRMRVSQSAQRSLNTGRVDKLVVDFDPEQMGFPVVSFRAGQYWIIDGQHRVEALKSWLGKGWETQKIECRVYHGMNEREEADMFDRLNNQLAVKTFDKFKVRVTAGRKTEVEVQKIVEREGLRISVSKEDGSVGAVGTLVKIYERSGPDTLARTLRLARDSFGSPGFTAQVLDGLSQLCQRYNGELKDDETVERLRSVRGGLGGVISRSEVLHKQTGNAKHLCVAAAIVDVLNARRGGRKLPSWWDQ